QILSSRKEIQERVQAKNRLSEVEQTTYFSSWLFSAVHMCLMIPDLQEISQISRYLGISVGSARRVLDFLVEHGLAEYKGDRVIAGPARIHLSRTSPLVAKHHTNWRMRAIESLDEPKPSDMHYSLVMSASPEAAEKIRDILLDAIQKAEPVLKATQDEGIYVLNMDLFGVKKD
ncbi:MAG TPA: DUF4423 domain-containing protein, partial [Bdellovibrio sp.]|nr:DUF4423 domain-containing protein [Bdellovibrio sp.]